MPLKLILILIIILVISFIALLIRQQQKKSAAIKDRHKRLTDVSSNIKVIIEDFSEESPENAKLLSSFDKVFAEKISKILESPQTLPFYDQLDREILNILSVLADIPEKNDSSALVELIKEWESKEI